MNKKLTTIGFTVVEWICVLIAAYYALQEPSPMLSFNVIGVLIYLSLAGVCEFVKYKINNNNHD